MFGKVIIAGDHSSLELKRKCKGYLESLHFIVEDLGTNSTDSVSYVDFAQKACKQFVLSEYSFGILICGTGIGISIAANKIQGIRCALPQNEYAAKMAKEHNNANFISFGSRISYAQDVTVILTAYINANFKYGRHESRIAEIIQLESRPELSSH